MNLNHANTSQHFIETIESGIHLLAPGWVAVRVRGAMIACQGPRSMSVSPFPMAHQAQATSSKLASLNMKYLVEQSLRDYCKWMLHEELDLAELKLISSPSKNFPSLWGKKKSDLAEVTMSKKAGWVVAAARRGIDVESQSLTRWKSLMINKFPGLAVQIHFSWNLNRIFTPPNFQIPFQFQISFKLGEARSWLYRSQILQVNYSEYS